MAFVEQVELYPAMTVTIAHLVRFVAILIITIIMIMTIRANSSNHMFPLAMFTFSPH